VQPGAENMTGDPPSCPMHKKELSERPTRDQS
jgi:hypothetical protein